MEKEEFSFTQKFVNVTQSPNKNKIEKVAQPVSQKVTDENFHNYVQGILLLLMEDDSMSVRIQGIKTMSLLAVSCVQIR